MAFVVVLDACVLVPHPLFDTLLRAADAGLYEPRWSVRILDEVERTLSGKLSIDPRLATSRITAMQRAFPHAQVDGYEDLVAAVRNDPKDRHVLAAAVKAGAGAIVTANLKDFPAAALEPYAIEALHPDDFLLDLLDLDRSAMLQLLADQALAYANPPLALAELQRHLAVTVPRFAAEAGSRTLAEAMPLPLETVSQAQVLEVIGGYHRRTPLSAVAFWWKLLEDTDVDGPRVAAAMSDSPAWAQRLRAAQRRLDGLSMISVVEHKGGPSLPPTAWVMFADLLTSTSARVLEPIPTPDMAWVEVVRSADGIWRVSGTVERPGGALHM